MDVYKKLQSDLRLMRDLGRSTLPVHLNILADLVEKARRYDQMPKIAKEAFAQ